MTGTAEKPVVHVDLCNIQSVDDFVKDPANAREVTAYFMVDGDTNIVAATRVYYMVAANPQNLAIESLGLTDDGTPRGLGIRLRIWRKEDRLGLKPPPGIGG